MNIVIWYDHDPFISFLWNIHSISKSPVNWKASVHLDAEKANNGLLWWTCWSGMVQRSHWQCPQQHMLTMKVICCCANSSKETRHENWRFPIAAFWQESIIFYHGLPGYRITLANASGVCWRRHLGCWLGFWLNLCDLTTSIHIQDIQGCNSTYQWSLIIGCCTATGISNWWSGHCKPWPQTIHACRLASGGEMGWGSGTEGICYSMQMLHHRKR